MAILSPVLLHLINPAHKLNYRMIPSFTEKIVNSKISKSIPGPSILYLFSMYFNFTNFFLHPSAYPSPPSSSHNFQSLDCTT